MAGTKPQMAGVCYECGAPAVVDKAAAYDRVFECASCGAHAFVCTVTSPLAR